MGNLDLLKNGLSSYGLNPNDWNLIHTEGARYLIVHRHERDFLFLGLTTTEPTLCWQQLVLPEI